MDNKCEIIGFLWSPSLSVWKQILTEMLNQNILQEYSVYNFGDDKKSYEEAILNIYKTDDISLDKVRDVKIKSMEPYENTFVSFTIKISPKYRTKQISKNLISTTVESIKKDIRGRFKSSVKNYIHDIIIHLADNTQQTRDIVRYMTSYSAYRQKTFVNIKKLLKNQMVNHTFNRVDILVRRYTIEKFLLDNNYDFEFYKKMQMKRVGCSPARADEYVTDFKKIIYSISQRGFDHKYPVPINSVNMGLENGSHRVATAYYLQLRLIPVYFQNIPVCQPYNRQWFEKNNFSDKHLEIIDNETERLKSFIDND